MTRFHIDVSRTVGGLQITVDAPPAPGVWVSRLSYAQAEELLTALRTDTACALLLPRGDVVMVYLPDDPQPGAAIFARVDGEVTNDLRNATHIVHTDLDSMRGSPRSFAEVLHAHMPHQAEPLPGTGPSPWTPRTVRLLRDRW